MSSSADNTISTCANCAKAESDAVNLKRCTACKMVKYCSRDCQVAHRPKHKKECKRRAAELFDEELFKDPPDGPECPICMLPLPFDLTSSQFYACCGKIICPGCVHAEFKEDIRNGKRREDCRVCAFCRASPTTTDEAEVDRLQKCVERNDAKSMEQLAIYYLEGKMGLQKDSEKAMELFQRAGEHGSATAYGRLGNIYNEGIYEDIKKAKYYWERGAIGGCTESRLHLAISEGRNGNNIRAFKHFLICAKAGSKASLDGVKLGFQHGIITKDEYTEALRAYQKQHDDRKSALRDEALVYDANPSLYRQICWCLPERYNLITACLPICFILWRISVTPLLHSTRHCDFNSRFDSILLFFRAPGDSEGAANKNNNLKRTIWRRSTVNFVIMAWFVYRSIKKIMFVNSLRLELGVEVDNNKIGFQLARWFWAFHTKNMDWAWFSWKFNQ